MATRARAGLLASRQRHSWVDLVMSTLEHHRQRAGGMLSAAMAFRLFLWVLPATLVLIGGLGFE